MWEFGWSIAISAVALLSTSRFLCSERHNGVIRGFAPAIVTHRVVIVSGCNSPDNFDESIGARERENAASMWSWSR
jgi:hypothetical protein